MYKNKKISVFRVIFVILVVTIAVFGGYFLGDEVRLAEKPAEYIGVIFSILAASLFAVISIVGDPGMIVQGSAREAWSNARLLQQELHRFNFLFYIYLITLGLLVVSELVEYANWERWFWISNVFTTFAILGFLLSLALPAEFAALQKRRLEQEITARNRGKK